MNPEEIQALEDHAAKGNPEACVKLSFHLMASDSSNPDSVKRAGALNQKAVEKFKNRLVHYIGRTSFKAADIEADSKMHLGLLYETGPVGIERAPVTAFYLIQDAFSMCMEAGGNPNFPILNNTLSNLESFGYGVYPKETDSWIQISNFSDAIDKFQNHINESKCYLNNMDASELESIVKYCNNFEAKQDIPEDILSELKYIKCRAKFLILGLNLSIKTEGRLERNVWLQELPYFFDRTRVLAPGNSLKFEIGSADGDKESSLIVNEILGELEKAALLKNGKATMEIARVWHQLFQELEDDQAEAKRNAFEKARNYYSYLQVEGDARALLHLGSLIWHQTPDSDGFGFKCLKVGADMLGPEKISHEERNFDLEYRSACFGLTGSSGLDVVEKIKYYKCVEAEYDFPDALLDDEQLWSASRTQRAEASLRVEDWKKTVDFISQLRKNKPLSRLVRTAEKFSPMVRVFGDAIEVVIPELID